MPAMRLVVKVLNQSKLVQSPSLTKPHSMVKYRLIEAVMQNQFSTFAFYTFYFYRHSAGGRIVTPND